MVIVEDLGGEEIVGFVIMKKWFGVFCGPHGEEGRGLDVHHAVAVIAVPHDSKAC